MLVTYQKKKKSLILVQSDEMSVWEANTHNGYNDILKVKECSDLYQINCGDI